MKPDVIVRGVDAALAEGVDHLCLLFGMSHGTPAGRACHLIATMSLATQAARLGAGRPGGYMGICAFNLVRAAAYREAGGCRRRSARFTLREGAAMVTVNAGSAVIGGTFN